MQVYIDLHVYCLGMGCFIHKVHAFFKSHPLNWSMAGTYAQPPGERLTTRYPQPPSFKNMVPNPPPGLSSIYQACKSIYPDQANPLQVTAVIKYW